MPGVNEIERDRNLHLIKQNQVALRQGQLVFGRFDVRNQVGQFRRMAVVEFNQGCDQLAFKRFSNKVGHRLYHPLLDAFVDLPQCAGALILHVGGQGLAKHKHIHRTIANSTSRSAGLWTPVP
jgi:hypothetical protein